MDDAIFMYIPFPLSCWVCSRQHHSACVGLEKKNERFICSGCQRKVQERTLAGGRLGGGGKMETPARQADRASSMALSTPYARTPLTSSFSRYSHRESWKERERIQT
jgi:hypothetical protein